MEKSIIIQSDIGVSSVLVDPVTGLPPEVMENVWQYLELKDLLNSLLISTSWNKYLKMDPVWKKYCKQKSNKLQPWKIFLKERKLDFCWENGIYQEFAMEASFQQICIGAKYIYLAEDETLTCYSPSLKILGSNKFSNKIHKMYSLDTYICILTKTSDSHYNINILKNLISVSIFETTSDKLFTTHNQICFKNESNLYLWTILTGQIQEFKLPWEIIEFYIYNNQIIVKRRCNYGFIISISSYNNNNNNSKWEDIFNSSNRSAMGFSSVYVKSDPKGVALLEIFQTDNKYTYSDLIIYGTDINFELGDSKRQYYKCCFNDIGLIFTDSWGHLINLNLINRNAIKIKLRSQMESILACGKYFILTYQNRWEFWNNNSQKYSVKKGFPSTTVGVGYNFVVAMSGRTINTWTFGDER